MISIDIYSQKTETNGDVNVPEVTEFLHEHLDEYGDEKLSIQKAIEHALSQNGRVVLAKDETKLVGGVVINKTGMSDYIPENILVYIAIHKNYRGKGIGKRLMNISLENLEGDVALHVEKDNPAKFLYESLGFTNPYLEMRLKRN